MFEVDKFRLKPVPQLRERAELVAALRNLQLEVVYGWVPVRHQRQAQATRHLKTSCLVLFFLFLPQFGEALAHDSGETASAREDAFGVLGRNLMDSDHSGHADRYFSPIALPAACWKRPLRYHFHRRCKFLHCVFLFPWD